MGNRRLSILGALTFLSFLLRLFTISREVAYPDSCLYLSFAKSILSGKFSSNFSGGVETILPPLYSLSDAMLSFLVQDIEISGVLVSAVAGALLILPVFYLAQAIYNEKAAWISSVLVFLSPILIHWSGVILTESLFITLFISGIASGWYAIERRKRIFFILSGALIGLSYMTRVIGLVALPVLGFWIIFYSIRHDESGNYVPGEILKELFSYLAILSLGFILVTGFYLIHLHSFYGHWTLAGAYGSVKGVIANEGAATTAGWENITAKKAEESLYVKFIKKVSINAKNYSISLLTMLLFTVVFVVGGIFFRWKVLYIISFIGVYFAALMVQPLSPLLDERIRYLSPILPLFLIMASGGITRIQGWVKWQVVRQAAIPVMAGIVLFSAIPQLSMLPIKFNKFWDKGDSVNIMENVGLWMKENLPHPIRIMTRKPFIAYYADAVWFSTPATYDEVIKLANSNAVDYIIVDRGIEYYSRPRLRFLFDPKQAPGNLKFMGGVQHPKTGELYIGVYKIKREGHSGN